MGKYPIILSLQLTMSCKGKSTKKEIRKDGRPSILKWKAKFIKRVSGKCLPEILKGALTKA